MPAARKRLYLDEVESLINSLISEGEISSRKLLDFAELINGGIFKARPAPKKKVMTMTQAKQAVLAKFNCRSATELKKNKTFTMAMTGEEYGLKTKEDWMKLYRRWIAVPDEERNQDGPTCINGIDVLENFRPWHVFGLDPNTATAEDVKASFRELAKTHHPDAGGDSRVFERIQKMRDSVLALMN